MTRRINSWLCLLAALGGVGCSVTGGSDVTAEEAKKSPPKTVLIIRHAEKPPPEAMSPDLNAAGKQRAEAIPELFKKSAGRPEPLPAPDVIFAAKDSAKSHRPTQTVAPLAAKLRLKVNTHFDDDSDTEKLAAELLTNPKYAGKTVLVAWRHGHIPLMAKALGAADAPAAWGDDVFDRVWKIAFDANGKATVSDLPQRLLKGDAEK